MTESVSPSVDVCVHCGGRMVEGRGFYVCEDCGVESDDTLLEAQYAVTPSDRKKAGGVPLVTFTNTLGSCVGYLRRLERYDARGKLMKVGSRQLYGRLHNHHEREKIRGRRDLSAAHTSLAAVCVSLSLPWLLRERAAHLLEAASKSKAGRVHRYHSLVAMAIYRASLDVGFPLPFQTVLDHINDFFGIRGHPLKARHVMRESFGLFPVRVTRAVDFVDSILTKVETNPEFGRRCKFRALSPYVVSAELRFRVVNFLESHRFQGRRPLVVAAAAIYLTDQRYTSIGRRYTLVSQQLVADAAGVSVQHVVCMCHQIKISEGV